MLTSKLVIATALVLATAGAYAEAGDVHINDWSTSGFTVTRGQVKAELREAMKLGLVSMGEGDAPMATVEQERLIAEAGQGAATKVAQSRGGEG